MMNENNNKLTTPICVDAGRGAGWISDGFGHFKSSPFAWIGAYIILFILVVLALLIPLVSLLLNIVIPVFVAGFMLGCREQDQGGAFRVGHLFAGFSKPYFSRLAIVGVLYSVGSIIIMIMAFIMLFFLLGGTELIEQAQSGQIEGVLRDPQPIILASLVGALLAMPLLMAIWFAPALVAFQDISPVDAMIASFKACLVNVIPFLIYGLVALILTILASIPLLLGHIILIPVLTASVYVAYRDIFQEQTRASL
jgi:uncharacterized membrane protein